MCFNRQSTAPIEKPSYAPSDAYKHFEVSQSEADLDKPTEPDIPSSPATGPKLRPTHDTIRM